VSSAAPAVDGKTVLITGASSGIGLVAARELSRMGARVLMACRDRARGEAAQAEVARAGGAPTRLLLADLSSQASIRALAAEVAGSCPRLDVLVNNAGGVNGRRELTADGLEKTFATNHLGYFLLANLLLDLLKRSAPSRIINVASAADRWGGIDFADLMAERRYSGVRQYATSKLCNVAFTFELARRLQGSGVTAVAVHPGFVASNFGQVGGGFLGFLSWLGRPFALTPERGADTVVWLAQVADASPYHGQYLSRRRAIRSKRQAYDVSVQRRLWEESERLTGLRSSGAAP
jgi:NAD(P)-dependent dehydrogenase (short-subunit alcohol dehydrogenase family)